MRPIYNAMPNGIAELISCRAWHTVAAATKHIVMSNGQKLYADNCARCHGDQVEGRSIVAPSLAGSRVVRMSPSIDTVRIVLYGGYTPGTELNPRPFGMPPFYPTLTSEQ